MRRTVPTLGLGLLALCLPACGGGSSTPPDAGPTNTGFVLPTMSTHANMQNTDKTWTDLGAADWTCLGTPSDDAPRTAATTLTGHVLDFQDMTKAVPGAAVDIFSDIDYTHPFASVTADGTGTFTTTIPVDKERVGFKVHVANYFDTFLLNQYWAPADTTDSVDIGDISAGLATALPAFIDFERVSGTGVLAGAMRDCQHREVSNAIATVSSTSMTATHLQGTVGGTAIIASTFYFGAGGTDLPVKHTGSNGRLSTNSDGLFTVFNLPPSDTAAYIQVWGFKSDGDVASGMAGLTLLAELPAPILGDVIVTGSIESLRTK